MIWKAKYTQPDIPEGTTREKRVFAWLPTLVNGDYVWFECYAILQVYFIAAYPAILADKQGALKVPQWIETSKRVIK